jgi:signal transduction histidine kinase
MLTDIEYLKRAQALLTGEKRILEMVAKGDALAQILDGVCRLVEEQASGVLTSILLVDGNCLRHGGAPSLPKAYTNAIDGGVIGPSAGSCGTAAYLGEQVIVEDIATDPLWAAYREVALPHALRACWSTPVFSSRGKIIATFAMYYREPHSPSPRDQEIIEQITHLAGVAIERTLTQDALRRSEAYLAEAQRLSHTGSWAFNAISKKAAYWSEENFRIWDFDLQRGPPDRDATWQRIHPEDRDRLTELSEKALREKTDYSCEFRIVLPDGAIRHIRSVAHPVFSASGDIVEIVGTDVDVTDRKRAEEEHERLRQLEADLAQVNRVSMLGELAASLSHEIKQPITAAAMNANACERWLRRDAPDVTKACDSAARMITDVTRAADIIERVRSLYRRDARQREPVDLNKIIREMVVLLHDTASRNSVSIRTALDLQLPAAIADRVQLQQVVMNLMLNGVEAMQDTGGELTVTSNRTEDDQLLISVRDCGIGLPANQTERIFEAFFTTKPQGTGMGLSTSQRIIESHGGRLWASGGSGRGATFLFSLPTDVTACVHSVGERAGDTDSRSTDSVVEAP